MTSSTNPLPRAPRNTSSTALASWLEVLASGGSRKWHKDRSTPDGDREDEGEYLSIILRPYVGGMCMVVFLRGWMVSRGLFVASAFSVSASNRVPMPSQHVSTDTYQLR